MRITVASPAGSSVELGTFPAPERYFDGSIDFPRPLGRLTSIAVATEHVFVGTGDYIGETDSTDIRVFSLTGAQLSSIGASFTRVRVTRRHISAWIEDRLARERPSQRDGLRQLYMQVQYPTWFPPYGRLLADPAGNLWVEEYPVPGARERRWRILSSSGRLAATMSVPAALRLIEVGEDYVLGIWRGEADEDNVRVYGVTKPSR